MKFKCFKSALSIVLCLTLLLSMAGCGSTKSTVKPLESITAVGDNSYTCEYDGMSRKYLEYAPDGDVSGVIIMLHGYGNDPETMRMDTKMDDDALERGYVVIYAEGSANLTDATSAIGWNSGIDDSTNDDIGFIKSLATYMQDKYSVTRENTFAVGFSNGGFMMYRIAVEASDIFAAVASVVGMMPESMWENRSKTTDISVLQINGTKDDVVPMNLNGSAKYSQAPAIEEVIEYFAAAAGLTQVTSESLSSNSEITKYSAPSKSTQVWQVIVEGGRHSWPAEELYGFDTNDLILDFFDQVG